MRPSERGRGPREGSGGRDEERTGESGLVVTLDHVKRDPEVQAYLAAGDAVLAAMGYTEHGQRHASLVASIARNILERLGFPNREAELAAIAGYLHDLGNVVCRHRHEQVGGVIAMQILTRLGLPPAETAMVVAAIGNHGEDIGEPVNNVAAALFLADKSDVHRTRVRNPEVASFDIHDRVNYAAQHSFVRVDEKRKAVTLELTIDTKISPVMDYFEIFLTRMLLCRRAARFLGCDFELVINDVKLL
ncbi:MAG: HD domain-containing protein [Firmicutes bacterium]|nr:HD domain-containing protein [Bacillota bacterium]